MLSQYTQYKDYMLFFRMGLTEENVEAIQKSWDIAKSVAKLRFRLQSSHIKWKVKPPTPPPPKLLRHPLSFSFFSLCSLFKLAGEGGGAKPRHLKNRGSPIPIYLLTTFTFKLELSALNIMGRFVTLQLKCVLSLGTCHCYAKNRA